MFLDKQPDAVAIVEDNRKASYRELDRMANDIMSKFYDCNYQFIGFIMSHSIEMIAATLAVLKSGAAYVPAETTLPGARAGYMMETAGASLVITDDYCRDLPHSGPLADRLKPDGLAYVLFTSGTTGRPKGVAVENHSVVNYAIGRVAAGKPVVLYACHPLRHTYCRGGRRMWNGYGLWGAMSSAGIAFS